MGREVRMVPKNWKHPKKNKSFVPLYKSADVAALQAKWDAEAAQWEAGFRMSFGSNEYQPRAADETGTFASWDGERPDPADYMPNWPASERTHLMMYEDTTEGTPISPAFATPEELARWLTDTGASSFGSMTATYEQWLATCRDGWAVSMVITGSGITSGVEYAARKTGE